MAKNEWISQVLIIYIQERERVCEQSIDDAVAVVLVELLVSDKYVCDVKTPRNKITNTELQIQNHCDCEQNDMRSVWKCWKKIQIYSEFAEKLPNSNKFEMNLLKRIDESQKGNQR